jgi:hypothetical protein
MNLMEHSQKTSNSISSHQRISDGTFPIQRIEEQRLRELTQARARSENRSARN